MRARNIVNGNVVWFNSIGNISGTKTIYGSRLDEETGTYPDQTSPVNIKKDSIVTISSSEMSNAKIYLLYRDDNFILRTAYAFDIKRNINYNFVTQYDIDVVKLQNANNRQFVTISWSKTLHQQSFVKNQDAIASILTQKLSILKGELWYKITYGLSLLEKVKSKSLIDIEILDIVQSQSGVIRVDKFSSSITNGVYSCNILVLSEYGLVSLSI